jgi:hypothetical protein
METGVLAEKTARVTSGAAVVWDRSVSWSRRRCRGWPLVTPAGVGREARSPTSDRVRRRSFRSSRRNGDALDDGGEFQALPRGRHRTAQGGQRALPETRSPWSRAIYRPRPWSVHPGNELDDCMEPKVAPRTSASQASPPGRASLSSRSARATRLVASRRFSPHHGALMARRHAPWGRIGVSGGQRREAEKWL